MSAGVVGDEIFMLLPCYCHLPSDSHCIHHGGNRRLSTVSVTDCFLGICACVYKTKWFEAEFQWFTVVYGIVCIIFVLITLKCVEYLVLIHRYQSEGLNEIYSIHCISLFLTQARNAGTLTTWQKGTHGLKATVTAKHGCICWICGLFLSCSCTFS